MRDPDSGINPSSDPQSSGNYQKHDAQDQGSRICPVGRRNEPDARSAVRWPDPHRMSLPSLEGNAPLEIPYWRE